MTKEEAIKKFVESNDVAQRDVIFEAYAAEETVGLSKAKAAATITQLKAEFDDALAAAIPKDEPIAASRKSIFARLAIKKVSNVNKKDAAIKELMSLKDENDEPLCEKHTLHVISVSRPKDNNADDRRRYTLAFKEEVYGMIADPSGAVDALNNPIKVVGVVRALTFSAIDLQAIARENPKAALIANGFANIADEDEALKVASRLFIGSTVQVILRYCEANVGITNPFASNPVTKVYDHDIIIPYLIDYAPSEITLDAYNKIL